MLNLLLLGHGYVGQRAGLSLPHAHITIETRSQKNLPPDPANWPPFDAIIFTAAAKSIEEYESAYLKNALKISQAKKSYVIYTSSTSVYCENSGKTVDENSPTHQGKILVETEKTLLNSHHDVCIFRLGEIIGPDRELKRKLGRTLPGTGDNFSNLVHVDDIIKAIHFALQKRLLGIYNLCSDIHTRRKDLYKKIAEKESLPLPIWDNTKASHHGSHKIVSSEKIKSLGFRFQPFANSISQFPPPSHREH